MNWVIITLLLVLSFLFSGLESALLTITRARVRHNLKGADERTAALEKLMQNRNEVLISILLVNNALNVVAFTMVAYVLSHDSPPLGLYGGFAVALAVSVPVYIVWVELLPKSIFAKFPFRLLVRFTGILTIVHAALGPLVRAAGKVMTSIWKPAAVNVENLDQGRAAFRELTTAMQREGTLNEEETGLIRQVLDFEKVTARELMLPMDKVTSVPSGMPLKRLIRLSQDTKLEEFPVMSASGELVGVVGILDVLKSGQDDQRASDFARKLVRAAPTEKAVLVLRKMRRAGLDLAIVFSASGRPMGLVTSHDIVFNMLRTES